MLSICLHKLFRFREDWCLFGSGLLSLMLNNIIKECNIILSFNLTHPTYNINIESFWVKSHKENTQRKNILFCLIQSQSQPIFVPLLFSSKITLYRVVYSLILLLISAMLFKLDVKIQNNQITRLRHLR